MMNAKSPWVLGLLSMFLSVAGSAPSHATVIPISLERYTFSSGSYTSGSYAGDLSIPDTTDLYEYVDAATTITPDMRSVQFQVNFRSDPNYPRPGNILAFRVFAANSWDSVWGLTSNPAPYGDVRLIRFSDSSSLALPVTIDLAPYLGSSVAMGWAFVSDVPTSALVTLSNIRLNSVPEPDSTALFGLGMALLSWPGALRRKRQP